MRRETQIGVEMSGVEQRRTWLGEGEQSIVEMEQRRRDKSGKDLKKKNWNEKETSKFRNSQCLKLSGRVELSLKIKRSNLRRTVQCIVVLSSYHVIQIWSLILQFKRNITECFGCFNSCGFPHCKFAFERHSREDVVQRTNMRQLWTSSEIIDKVRTLLWLPFVVVVARKLLSLFISECPKTLITDFKGRIIDNMLISNFLTVKLASWTLSRVFTYVYQIYFTKKFWVIANGRLTFAGLACKWCLC